MEPTTHKTESGFPTLAHSYTINVAKTLKNGLESNILKMDTLSKLNAAAYETYEKAYDSLTKSLEDTGYSENKKVIVEVVNEIDGIEKEISELEQQAKMLDDISIALEKKVEKAKEDISKTKAK